MTGHRQGLLRCRRLAAVLLAGLFCVAATRGQVPPEKAAEMVLNSARKAFNEKNYPFAIERFREYLTKYPAFKEAPSARYGLAIALLEQPNKNLPDALKELQQIAGNKEIPEHAHALYFLGQTLRGLGVAELAIAQAKPAEAPQRLAQAKALFTDAAKNFAASAAAFTAQFPPKIDPAALPAEVEWAARARCDLAEMQLRLEQPKEALASTALFTTDPNLAKSRYHHLGLYYHGFANFLLGENLAAGKFLSQLAPFGDPVFGNHARYLLARVHHLGDERPEASFHYQGVLDDYVRDKAAAVKSLQNPAINSNPGEKARLEALVKAAPDHVGRAAFFLGVLRYETGQYGNAQPLFAGFAKEFPTSPLLPEALLRLGFCNVQLKQWKEAIDVLTPLATKEPKLADQAQFWLGKAQIGMGDPANPPAYDAALKAGLATLGQAAATAQNMIAADPTARGRRGDVLLEIGDVQQQAKLYKEAAATYNTLLTEKLLPARDEEVTQRQITALHLAGDHNGSDVVATAFFKAYPKSPLLPAVAFRYAENAFFRAQAAPPPDANRPKLFDEAIKRYDDVINKYGSFALVNLARYGQGLAYYHKGDIDKARATLNSIADPDRGGELAPVNYLLADCVIRQAPQGADDAISAGRLREELVNAIKLLDAYIGAEPKAALTPDALLKLGYCHGQMAPLFAEAKDKNESIAKARATYERLMREFPQDPLIPQAVFERAKTFMAAGDVNTAMNELNRFNADPLRQSAIAPMAVLRQASLLRGVNRAPDAANLLAQCRQAHEANMLKDPARAGQVPLLRYHHGLALKEAAKLPDARAVFDSVVKQSPEVVEAAESSVRFAQCLREEGLQKMDAARKVLGNPASQPPQKDEARKTFEAGLKEVRDSAVYLEGHIATLKQKQPTWEARARMLYDAAWGYRTVAELEYAAARDKIQQDTVKKLEEEAKKNAAPNVPPRMILPPDVSPKQVPIQPAEQKVRDLYKDLMTSFAESPLVVEARFELAEMLADRLEYDAAAKMLNEALEAEPRADLVEKIRLRMGTCLAEKAADMDPAKATEDLKQALAQFEIVANNEKSPNSPQGRYRAGEVLLALKDNPKAIAHLAAFRDKPPYQNVPGLTDRALLRLGHAYARQKQWAESRQALEILMQRFPNSPWLNDTRYSLAWAMQNQGQFDPAVALYTQVTAQTMDENAAKAQLQIGLCRMAQQRFPEATTALLVVPFTYDYPELSATALFEAAKALTQLKQPIQSRRLLERLIKDYPDSPWAKLAREQLEKELKK